MGEKVVIKKSRGHVGSGRYFYIKSNRYSLGEIYFIIRNKDNHIVFNFDKKVQGSMLTSMLMQKEREKQTASIKELTRIIRAGGFSEYINQLEKA